VSDNETVHLHRGNIYPEMLPFRVNLAFSGKQFTSELAYKVIFYPRVKITPVQMNSLNKLILDAAHSQFGGCSSGLWIAKLPLHSSTYFKSLLMLLLDDFEVYALLIL